MSAALALSVLTLVIWGYLLLGRGFFWRAGEAPVPKHPQRWPRVTAIVPARDEAETVGRAVASLLAQDYPGEFSVVLVDDHSQDGTAEIARDAAAASGRGEKLRVVSARTLPPGWSGKLWALSEGVLAAAETGGPPELYLFTDADIGHHRQNLSELVARLEEDRLDLASLMVKLHCQSQAEKFMIPAFVWFFALLRPFSWVNDPARRTAAAAGGCILVRRSAYERIGGYAAIHGELIDDCALAREVKRGGRIWLGLTRKTVSLRAYPRLRPVWDMVARTAYEYLDFSPWKLLGTTLGMGLAFLAPPVLALAGGASAWLALAAWAMMALAYAPMLSFYRVGLWRAPLLPAVALLFLGATLDSAWRHMKGKGGLWKGRVSWQSQR
ncbi:MAG TPA: glycosyltransferase [Stellaceae bacterium]|nr:glycosyltransferase [Stellaceae bacterium]